MYNRYLSSAYGDRPCSPNLHNPPPPPPPSCEPPEPPCGTPPHGRPPEGGGGLFSGISEALTGRLQNLHFDLDTLIILIAVYFLIADSEDFDTDLLVLIGVLFVLGL